MPRSDYSAGRTAITAGDAAEPQRAVRLSIVIPSLDEAAGIVATLEALRPLRDRGHEVIVVDAGDDATATLARCHADQVLRAPRGRAVQMNRGAEAASGEVLLFLHADTRLPPAADLAIVEGLAAAGRGWGRFDVRLTGRRPLLRVIGALMSWAKTTPIPPTAERKETKRVHWFSPTNVTTSPVTTIAIPRITRAMLSHRSTTSVRLACATAPSRIV